MAETNTQRVMFTRDTDLAREGAEFKQGSVHELSQTSAHRWFKRNAAVPVDEPAKRGAAHADEAPAKKTVEEAPEASKTAVKK